MRASVYAGDGVRHVRDHAVAVGRICDTRIANLGRLVHQGENQSLRAQFVQEGGTNIMLDE
jgi:hypothetical protein